jgi:ribosomal protein L37E
MFQDRATYEVAPMTSDTPRAVKRRRLADRREKERAQYEARKVAFQCTRCGVDVRHLADQLCPECRAYANTQTRESTRKLSATRRKKKQCARCGRPSPDRYECIPCLARRGQAPLRTLNQTLNPTTQTPARWHTEGKRNQVRQVTEGDGRTRNRNTGRGRPGGIGNQGNDELDARLLQRELESAIAELAYAHSPEVKAKPRLQARDILHTALSRLHLVQRLLMQILQRHRYVQ